MQRAPHLRRGAGMPDILTHTVSLKITDKNVYTEPIKKIVSIMAARSLIILRYHLNRHLI